MKYLEAYSRFIKDNIDLENDIRYTVRESLIDLIQANMNVSCQVQTDRNRIVIYMRLETITERFSRSITDPIKVFSFDEIKDSVYHLISTMEDNGYPLVKSEYRRFGNWENLWNVEINNKIDPNIFGDLNIDNVDSFEIIFNLK